ncbi:MAG: phage tail protein, partial [Planctomycetota bacterium]
MPKTHSIKQSFNAGELSPLMDSRIDQAKYVAGCRILENFIPLIYGGVERRPGTEYIATQKSSAAVGRAVAFEHSVDDTYILLFENQLIRVFRSGARVTGTATNITAFADYSGTVAGTVKVTSASHGLITGDMTLQAGTTSYNGDFSVTKIDANNYYITDTWVANDATGTTAWSGITTPYLTADLFDLDIKQSADVMFIAHDDYEPRKLSRTGHTNWTLVETDFRDGPFRDQNTDTADTIKVDEIANGGIALGASVTLTATGHTPFVDGTTAGHKPSGALATSKSKTGALFKLVYGVGTSYISGLLDPTGANSTGTLTIYKGVTWDLVTNGTWGQAADSATIVLERSYDAGTTYETVVSFTSAANYNIDTSGTEENEDALYRLTVTEITAGATKCAYNLSVRDTDHIGIVEITSVTSTSIAIGTVVQALGLATDTAVTDTYRWSEGAWSNYRGWPRTVDISPEERLTFGGSSAEPLTVWGSVIGNYSSFKKGDLDDDAIVFTLIGSGQQ